MYHIVNKHRRWLMQQLTAVRYATFTDQSLGISKWYACGSCTKSSRVNAKYQSPRVAIIVIFPVKLFHHRHDLRRVAKWIHYTYAARQLLPRVMKIAVEG